MKDHHQAGFNFKYLKVQPMFYYLLTYLLGKLKACTCLFNSTKKKRNQLENEVRVFTDYFILRKIAAAL